MKHLLLLFVLCLSLQASAQERHWVRDPKAKGPFIWAGDFSALNLQVRGPGLTNLSGALVTIVSRKDTITLITDNDGSGGAYCDALLADSVWIKVSHKDYETVEGKIRSRSSYEVHLKKKNTDKQEVESGGAGVKDTVKLQ